MLLSRLLMAVIVIMGSLSLVLCAWIVFHKPKNAYSQMCEAVWMEMSPAQKQAEAPKSHLMKTCEAALYVAKCHDGYIARSVKVEALCARHGGEKTLIKFPDA